MVLAVSSLGTLPLGAGISSPSSPPPPPPPPAPAEVVELINVSRYNPFVREYYCNIIASGGNIYHCSLAPLHRFVNRLIRTGLWAKIDEIYPFCGQRIASAVVKLKYTSSPFMTNHNFVDEDFEEWGPGAGLTPDGSSKYLDTNLSAAALPDNAHLCYIEYAQTGTGSAFPVSALGVTDGSLEWKIGAQIAVDDRSAIIGSPASVAQTATPYSNWTSFYIASRLSPESLTLFKRTHLKDTDTTTALTSPKPSLNIFLAARNNNGVPDQFFANPIRFASVGHALTPSETIDYYQLVQALQDSLGRAV